MRQYKYQPIKQSIKSTRETKKNNLKLQIFFWISFDKKTKQNDMLCLAKVNMSDRGCSNLVSIRITLNALLFFQVKIDQDKTKFKVPEPHISHYFVTQYV